MAAAHVILDSRGPFADTRLADAGKEKGVEVGNPVMNERGLATTRSYLDGLNAIIRHAWSAGAPPFRTAIVNISGWVLEQIPGGLDPRPVPFATVERATGRVIGSTRYMNIDRANRRVEIGATWIAKPWQRTAMNTEAKYLMLRHAFETLGCVRVELKTDALNEKSRNAILRIGAKEEGTLRRHMVTWTGRLRDSVYFSVLDSEWLQVKAELEAKLKRAG